MTCNRSGACTRAAEPPRPPRLFRKSEPERRAFAGFRFDPNPPAMALYDPLHQRQANAGAGILAAVEALEYSEYLLVIAGVDPHAVILERKLPVVFVLLRRDVDSRRHLAAVLDRIADQVLKHLTQLHEIGCHRGQRIVRNFGA